MRYEADAYCPSEALCQMWTQYNIRQIYYWHHCGCHGNLCTIAVRYVADTYHPKEPPYQIWTQYDIRQKSYWRITVVAMVTLDEVSGCCLSSHRTSIPNYWLLLVPWTKNHLSSFKCGFLNIFRAKTCWVVCNAYCFCYVRTNMVQRNVWKKPHSIRLLRWFKFSQSGSKKNNRKTFEGASVEPTT